MAKQRTKEKGVVRKVKEDGELISEIFDREKVDDATISELETAVGNIKDKPTRNTVLKIVEILTGQKLEVDNNGSA